MFALQVISGKIHFSLQIPVYFTTISHSTDVPGAVSEITKLSYSQTKAVKKSTPVNTKSNAFPQEDIPRDDESTDLGYLTS